MIKPPRTRCAIYTRKSSEEGLDQAFNSLHAQREACEAYIRSQSGEGWVVIPTAYDDGGCSGGNMDRPALQRLLADVDAGLVDTIVVYKIDRLTRALSDFARIVERLDEARASFVSVTQSFNTTTSMGRLTLNVLLSFAQFEREVTGERIRDKIAASKKKGMWMGGVPPLGYDLPTDKTTRKLVINPAEAEQVRRIFGLYLKLGTVSRLMDQLEAEGARSKAWTNSRGEPKGGLPFSRGALFHLLKNRVFVGEIVHGSTSVPDAHPPIVESEVFDQVQAQLAANASDRKDRPLRSADLPLKGRLFDADGAPMSPSFGYGRGGRVYRYYVSAPLQQGRKRKAGDPHLRRLKAEAIHDLVHELLAGAFGRPDESLPSLLPRVSRIEVYGDCVRAQVPTALLTVQARASALPHPDQAGTSIIVAPVRCQSRGGRVWSSAPVGPRPRKADPTLVKGLREAHRIARAIGWSPATGVEEGARLKGPESSYGCKLVRLAFLAPDIQKAVLEGRQPPSLMLSELLNARISPCWQAQRRELGFEAAHP